MARNLEMSAGAALVILYIEHDESLKRPPRYSCTLLLGTFKRNRQRGVIRHSGQKSKPGRHPCLRQELGFSAGSLNESV